MLDLLGKLVRIRSRSKSLARQNAGRLVITMAVSVIALKPRDQHVGAKGADDTHNVSECGLVPLPFLKRLIGIFGEPEIGDAGEALLHSVITIRFRQLQCPQNTEHIEKVAAHLILPAFPAIQG